MRHILRTEDNLCNLVNLNDVGHLREVADEAFRSLTLCFRTHQTDEIRFNRCALQNGVDTLRLLWTADDKEALLLRPLRLEVLVTQQDAYESREAHLQGQPQHSEEYQCSGETQTQRQQGIQHQNDRTTEGHA